MKKQNQDQAAMLRGARARLKLTNEELAAELGVSQATLTAWLAPKSAAKHRTMKAGPRLLLARLLAAKRR